MSIEIRPPVIDTSAPPAAPEPAPADDTHSTPSSSPILARNSTLFPTTADADTSLELDEHAQYWDGRTGAPNRTVRRKKSSFDLRDVYKNDGASAAPRSQAVTGL